MFDIDIIESVKEIINTHEQCKNAYFWIPPKSAGQRRALERKIIHPEVTWEEGGDIYSAETFCECSVNHVYYRAEFTKNGKKTNIVPIRTSYERMVLENALGW